MAVAMMMMSGAAVIVQGRLFVRLSGVMVVVVVGRDGIVMIIIVIIMVRSQRRVVMIVVDLRQSQSPVVVRNLGRVLHAIDGVDDRSADEHECEGDAKRAHDGSQTVGEQFCQGAQA